MGDFIKQLAEEAGQHYTKSSVRLRGSGNNDSINSAIRRMGGRGNGGTGFLGSGDLNAQIRKEATANNISGDVDAQIRSSSDRFHVGSTGGSAFSIDRNLADRISHDLLEE